MRIWVQSGGPLSRDSVYSRYAQSLSRHVQEVARADTVVDVHNVEGKPPGRERLFSSQHIVASWMVKNAVRAEIEGYDAFASVQTFDPAFYEIREMINIPVAFAMESSLYLACMLAPRFAFLAHSKPVLLRLTETAKRYGLTERMAPGGCLNLDAEDVGDVFNNPEPYVRLLTEEARRIISQGADILLVAGNPFNMLMVDQGVREIDRVPILDVCGAVIKVAEMMVDLEKMGITRSRSGLFAQPSQEERAQLRKLYGVDE